MSLLYQHGNDKPYHLSVGAVLFNDQMEICTHHLYLEDVPKRLQLLMGGLSEAYYLMRETVENDESITEAVHRGIQEEFGATGTIERFLGSLVVHVKTPTFNFEKTTLYHAVRLTSLGERTGTDEESGSVIEWHTAQHLLDLYRTQATLTDREELDETNIIERFIKAYGL